MSGFARSAIRQSIERGGSHIAVQDTKVHKDAKIAIEKIVVPLITATGQADVIALKHRPGFSFQIVGCEVYCRTEAGAVTADVKIGATSVLTGAMAFATGARVDGVLHGTLANVRGSATDEINVHFTTDGTGALTNGFVVVSYRPVPLNAEIWTE